MAARLAVSLIIATLVGVGGALFLAAPAVFADGSDDERRVVVAVLSGLLGFVGIGLGFACPHGTKILPWFLATPTILTVVVFSELDENMIAIALMAAAGAIGFSVGGILWGARRRRSRESRLTQQSP